MTLRFLLPLALVIGLASVAGVAQESQPDPAHSDQTQPDQTHSDQTHSDQTHSDQNQEPEPVYVFGTTVVIPSGLKGVIYYISHSAKNLAELEKDKPRGTIYTSSLNIPVQDYKLGFPGIEKRLEWFAIDYRGRFWIDKPGEYRWELMSDDGSMLYIDDNLVIDNGGLHAPQTRTGMTRLSGGIHSIRVPYFQGIKFQVALVLKIAPPGEKLRVFSTEEFKPPADPETWAFPETPGKAQK